MSRTPRKTWHVVLTVVTLLAIPAAVFATHSWNNYHWARTSNPFTIKLGDNVDANWDFYLNQASSDWSASNVLNTTVVAGGTTGRRCRATSGRAEVCNAAYGNNGWLGLASISISGSHITQGTVKVNDSYYNTAKYNTPAWRASVMCQEIGHIFGLGHNDEDFNTTTGTCMDYSNTPDANQRPNQHDYDMLASIYAHLDSTTTIKSPPPPAMNQIDMDGEGQWGRLVRGGRATGTSVYEQDWGGGHKTLTVVTWTEEARQAAARQRDGH